MFSNYNSECLASFVYVGYKDACNFQTAFYATLLSGAIPIINSYNFNVLGLSDLIEWDNVVIRTTDSQLPTMLEQLNQLDSGQLLEMRRKAHFYFLNLLADTKGMQYYSTNQLISVLIRSTLSAVRYRLQIPAQTDNPMMFKMAGVSIVPNNHIFKEHVNLQSAYTSLKNARYVYNTDPTFMDAFSPYDNLWKANKWMSNTGILIPHWTNNNRGMKYASKLNGNVPDEEFTILVNAYKRDEQLKHVLQTLNGLRFVRQVLVLWSDVQRNPPPARYWPQLHVPVHFILSRNSSLNERFLPYDLIDTEAVLSMDDDFEVDNEHIEFAFRVWRENRNVLVGPNERLGYTDPITMRGVYKTEIECRYNIILTSGAFLHRNYLVAYLNTMPSAVREWVDKVTNCEDIAMNFMISHLSRKPSIKVTPVFRTTWVLHSVYLNSNFRGSLLNGVGLSKRKEHKWNREKCLQVFEEIYGYNPLLLSEYRIDSSHYQHDTEYRCFKNT